MTIRVMDDAWLPPIFSASREDGGGFVLSEVTAGDGVPSKHLDVPLVDEDSIDNAGLQHGPNDQPVGLRVERGGDGFQESILVLPSVMEVQPDVCVDATAMRAMSAERSAMSGRQVADHEAVGVGPQELNLCGCIDQQVYHLGSSPRTDGTHSMVELWQLWQLDTVP